MADTNYVTTSWGTYSTNEEKPWLPQDEVLRNTLPVRANNKYLQALTNWDIKGDPARAEFRDWAMSNPKDFENEFKLYKTALSNLDIETLYKAKDHPGKVFNRNTNMELGKAFYKALKQVGFPESLIYAILANSYHETQGWTKDKLTGGPAVGLLQMEKAERNENYLPYLKQHGLNDDVNGLASYLYNMYGPNANILATADSRNGRRGYTTSDAKNDWYSNDILTETKAFEKSYERAGKPQLGKRLQIAKIFERYRPIFFGIGGKLNYLNYINE